MKEKILNPQYKWLLIFHHVPYLTLLLLAYFSKRLAKDRVDNT